MPIFWSLAARYFRMVKTISYAEAARRALRKLPAATSEQIGAKLKRYAMTGAGDVKAVAGAVTLRLRVGDYRVIFDENPTNVHVLLVGHRREIYR
jgi:mRNA interferase RelE/StbE